MCKNHAVTGFYSLKFAMLRFGMKSFVTIIVIAMITLSFSAMMSLSHHEQNVSSGANIKILSLGSSSGALQGNTYVKSTLVLANDTLFNGNFVASGGAANPFSMAFDPSNGYLYVANFSSNSVSVINTTQNLNIENIPVGSEPIGVVYDPINGYVYVSNFDSIVVSVINTTLNKVVGTIRVGTSPYGMAYDSANGLLYIACMVSGNVYVVNPATNSVSSIIDITTVSGSTSNPTSIAFDPDNNLLYVADFGSADVSVISGSSNTVVDTISVYSDPLGIAVDPSNGYIYVAMNTENSVSVINGQNDHLVNSIAVGSGPDSVVYVPSDGDVYVSNGASNSVSVINTSSESLIYTVIVGNQPEGEVFNPYNGFIYVADYASGTLSLLAGPNFAVKFTERGLTEGSIWYVNMSDGRSSGPISGNSYLTYLLNGTYNFTVTTENIAFRPLYSSSFTLSGSPLDIPILFSKEHTVTFTETGLQPVDGWYVVLFYSNGTEIYDQQSVLSVGQSISYTLPDGNYSYQGHIASSLYIWYYPGNFTILNENVNVSINFSKSPSGMTIYQAHFLFTGINPVNTLNISIDGYLAEYNGYNSIYYALDNGTYTLLITYMDDTAQGNFTIDGSDIVIYVNFSSTNQHQYLSEFHEMGLPNGITWFVNFSNGQEFISSYSTLYISLPNGTYFYSVTASNPSYKAAPHRGILKVIGGEALTEIHNHHLGYINIRFHLLKHL